MAAAFSLAVESPWVDLFDGKTLNGWTPSENKDSWKAIDGELRADGPRSHLFYSASTFKNFEAEYEVNAAPAANSGFYFHTKFQERGFPNKGFEVQVNNTAGGEGTYRERKKTGSLYGLRNVHKQIVGDNEWFKVNVLVRGKNIQVRVNGMLVVDFTEPTPAYVPKGHEPERFLDQGTFALQCHDPGSKVRFRKLRARALPDGIEATGAAEAPVVDETFRSIIDHGRNNIALVDFDVRMRKPADLEKLLLQSRRDGFQLGLTSEARDDKSALQFLDSLKGQLVFSGLRISDPKGSLPKKLTRATAAKFDYILADAFKWTEAQAKQALATQPIDVCANLSAGFLKPELLAIMAKNKVALQMNEHDGITAALVMLAKKSGVKLSFGSGYNGVGPLPRCIRGVALAKECKLDWPDFWVAGAWGSNKAIERVNA